MIPGGARRSAVAWTTEPARRPYARASASVAPRRRKTAWERAEAMSNARSTKWRSRYFPISATAASRVAHAPETICTVTEASGASSTVRRSAVDYFGSLVRRAKARGELRPGVPEAAVLFLLDALFDRFLQAVAVPALDVTLGLNQAPEEMICQRIHELVGLLREGLAA